MNTYRLKIKPQSSFLTPWQADTVFGSLCWIIAWRYGEEALTNFLQEYKSHNPVFVLSDGMPGDLLPAPSHLPYMLTKTENREDYEKGKKLKKVFWISAEKFESVRRGHIQDDIFEDDKPFKNFTSLHSSINRVTGTTGEEGALFELQEYALGTSVHTISIYLKIRDGWEEKVFSLFNDLSLMGYGKKKSVGKGSFKIIGGLERFVTFESLEDSNGFVSLSNFVPSVNDPTEGYYKTTYGNGKHCTLTGPPPKTYNNPKPVNGRCPSNYSLFLGGCVETYLVNGLSNTMSNYKEMLMGFGYFDPSCPPGWVRTGNWCENPRYKR